MEVVGVAVANRDGTVVGRVEEDNDEEKAVTSLSLLSPEDVDTVLWLLWLLSFEDLFAAEIKAEEAAASALKASNSDA
jgi:hypothetical protein